MQVIVSDSSVIIDLAKVKLVEPAFSLPYEFIIPDTMFEDELLDLGGYKGKDLIKAGVNTAVLYSDGVSLAFRYAAAFHDLTTNDCFAMALAKTTEGSLLLTGDGPLRKTAPSEEVEVRGLLWLCDEMSDHEAVDLMVLHDALVALDKDPFVWLPRTELRKRIQRLRKSI